MKRELCEFYRDRGCTDLTIPGLLAFLRDKLPYCKFHPLVTHWADKITPFDHRVSGGNGEPPDYTESLALAGKAALEALDDT